MSFACYVLTFFGEDIMSKAHLTKRFIDKTPFATGKTPTIFWDTELKGYALKVTRTRKSFFAQVWGGQVIGEYY